MAILAAVLVPTVVNKINDAKVSAAKSDLSTIANAIQSEIISITTGSDATNNKYVAGSAGAVTGAKVTTEGKVSIDYNTTDKKFVITHSDLTGDNYLAYTVDSTGKVATTTTPPASTGTGD